MGVLAQQGRDKLTLVTSPSIKSFGLWVEQLIAESTGKEGLGIVPVAGEPLAPPNRHGHDRSFLYLSLAGDDHEAAGAAVGTDWPRRSSGPGVALDRGVRVVAEAGMSNYATLRSGTASVGRYVADHLGLDGNFGTVAVGQRADLVLLRKNPLDDLENLTDRVGVMVRGRWTTRAEIDAGLAALAEKHAGRTP